MGRPTVEQYARGVERLRVRLLGSAQVLSRRDWELLLTWHDRGIPLKVIEEAIEAASERRGKPRGPRGLRYLAPAVEETWRVVIEGRLESGSGGPAGLAPPADPVDRWRSRRKVEADGSPLARLLDALLVRVDRGEAADELDRCLDRALPEAAPVELRRSCEAEVEARLEPFTARMEPATLALTRRRGCVDLLRRALDLPRALPSTRDK